MLVITIRPIIESDIPQTAPLLHSMWLLHADETPRMLNRAYLEAYDVEGYIRDILNDPNQVMFIAESDGRIVGAARAEIMQVEKMYAFSWILYLDDLVVHPEYRHRGIADLLVERRIEFARDKGISAVRSKIYSFNRPSRELALKHGFRSVYEYYYKFLDPLESAESDNGKK